MNDWTFVAADDEALDDVLSGRPTPMGYPWPKRTRNRVRLSEEIGALVRRTDFDGRDRPAALVVGPDTGRRLFGRYAQLRSDLAPLSAWTHVLDWSQFEQLHDDERPAQLEGFEASWTGLCVAEALMLSDRPLSQMRIAACLATPSFAIARSHALWQGDPIEAVLSRYDQCQRLLRTSDGSANRLREAFLPVWRALINASAPQSRGVGKELRTVSEALIKLRIARDAGRSESQALGDVFTFPAARFLSRLDTLSPEARLREFDRLIVELESLPDVEQEQRLNLQCLAGYLATVAAGGSPSLGLAEKLATRWPQITAWAYVIGGIGEKVTWTSSFDGLGRLVVRELLRPFRLDEAPTSDFALAEAVVLVDRALTDPLVHLRIKQSRVLSVAIMPGVNIAVPFVEPTVAESRPSRTEEPVQIAAKASDNGLSILAKLLAPYLLEHLYPAEPEIEVPQPQRRQGARGRGTRKDTQLSLNVDRDRQR